MDSRGRSSFFLLIPILAPGNSQDELLRAEFQEFPILNELPGLDIPWELQDGEKNFGKLHMRQGWNPLEFPSWLGWEWDQTIPGASSKIWEKLSWDG